MLPLFLLAAVATAPSVAAIDAAIKADDAAAKACMDDPRNYGQGAMDMCAGASFKRADAALNVQWPKTYAVFKRSDAASRQVGGSASANGAESLLKGQRGWLIYREATCQAVGSSGGTIAPMNLAFCMATITWTRVKELADLTIDPNSGEQM